MAKIVYNKGNSGKLLSRGGPRDIQNRQRLEQQRAMCDVLSSGDIQDIRPHLLNPGESRNQVVDLSQYLSLEDVRHKIEEAVHAVRTEDRVRYESGLNGLNDQLNESRKKFNAAQEELINKNSEISRLKDELQRSSVSLELQGLLDESKMLLQQKDSEISTLKSTLKLKDDFYESTIKSKEDQLIDLRRNVDTLSDALSVRHQDLEDLQAKLDRLYDKISSGSIKPLVGSHMDRPSLEDKIFIDPIDTTREDQMDSHIEVIEEASVEEVKDRNIRGDLAKLKALLKL